MWNVYDLIDQEGQTVYVGMSKHLKTRLSEHTVWKPALKSGRGKFYGRTDLDIITISSHRTRKKAMEMEGARKLSLGMEWTEKIAQRKGGSGASFEDRSRGGKIGGLKASASPNAAHKQRVKCPHCDMVSSPGAIGVHIKAKHRTNI